jgi:hypothetical protein
MLELLWNWSCFDLYLFRRALVLAAVSYTEYWSRTEEYQTKHLGETLAQVAKVMVKTLSELGNGRPNGTLAYLGDVQRLAAENSKISKGEVTPHQSIQAVHFHLLNSGDRVALVVVSNNWDLQGLRNFGMCTASDWLNYDAIIEAYQARAARMIGAVALQLGKADNLEAGMYTGPFLELS